ncbi:MAG: ABC transporter ATP-binding protein [Phycisphaerales bacterium]|nr:ABC transporter ATP-binding protein [Phycisphaerales bacterium]
MHEPPNTSPEPTTPAGAPGNASTPVAQSSPAASRFSIIAQGVRKTFPILRSARRMGQHDRRVALHGADLSIPAGQWVALLGPNGSGKSTLLKALATLHRPDSGQIQILGHDALAGPRPLLEIRARIGVAFQSPALDPMLTVCENLELAAALLSMPSALAKAAARDAAAMLGVSDRMNDRVKTLSGGLARRVDLARATLARPDILFLDEPTSGLDLRARMEFFGALDQARRARTGVSSSDASRELSGAPSRISPLTVIMSTHLMDEAERADRIILLHDGQIVADGTPTELQRRLGGTVIRVTLPPGEALDVPALLSGCGLEVTTEPGGIVLGRSTPSRPGTPARTDDAVKRLTHAGLTFQVGPPTLADLYLSLTGKPLLSEDVAAAPSKAAKGRRR